MEALNISIKREGYFAVIKAQYENFSLEKEIFSIENLESRITNFLENLNGLIVSNPLEYFHKTLYSKTTKSICNSKLEESILKEFLLNDISNRIKIYGVKEIPWGVIDALIDMDVDVENFFGWITFEETTTFLRLTEGSGFWEKIKIPTLRNRGVSNERK